MGFGIATNRVSDTSEVFYFFRKKKKKVEANMTNTNSCSLKAKVSEFENWQQDSQPLLP